MLEFFLNPAYLAAGGALVSAPIIIHLINRMKFRRVRWAAMEFLLKSQKRNRRRLIIEQMLLLLLRCLLVLLAVLLVARFVGLNFAQFFQSQTSTLHVIVLDDSPSMGDQWTADGETKTTFDQARALILSKVIGPAVRTPSPQHVILLPLSRLEAPLFDQPLNEQARDELQGTLDELGVSPVRVELLKGIEMARVKFDEHPEARRYLHLVGDFRDRDWADADTNGLQRNLVGLVDAGVNVRLIDAAHPIRNELQRTPPAHENIGVVSLRPEMRLAAKDLPIEFEVAVRNFSLVEYQGVRLAVKVNGVERADASVNFPSLPPGTHTQKFQVVFDKAGFNQVTANLDPEKEGLPADNTHYTVVEVRNEVPVLVVDGERTVSDRTGGDLHMLKTLFASAKGYQLVVRDAGELERPTLEMYPSIFLVNLNERNLTDKAIKNLEEYVKGGGGVAVFLGPRVRADFYNEKLHANGKGFFPAPLADRAFPSVNEPELPESDATVRLHLGDEKHPVLEELRKFPASLLQAVPIRRYWPVNRRVWKPEPGQVEPLVLLPNQRKVREFADEAKGLLKELEPLLTNREHEKYHPGLQRYVKAIREALADRPLSELGNALEGLLKDKGDEKDPQRPNLSELWDRRSLRDLRSRIDTFRATVQYGDPLVIAKRHGRGRVVAFLTTLGSAPENRDPGKPLPSGWHNWAGGSGALVTFPAIMLDMQKYLSGGGGENLLTMGTPAELQAEATRYAPRLRRFFRPEAPEENKPEGKGNDDQDLGEQTGAISGNLVTFRFHEAERPGVYLFELTQLADENNTNPRTETRAFVYNLDPDEGDLRRASVDDLDRATHGAPLQSPDTQEPDSFTWQSSLSESPWFYLVFLIVLVLEQALAVHLSYHVRGAEAA